MPCPTPTSEERSLIQEIKDSDPADNAIRQVYADWLLDQGREEQAEFVRYQKDHDDPFTARRDPGAGTPEGIAAREYATRTLKEWVGPVPYEVNVQCRRGLLHAVIPMEAFLEGRYGAGLHACRRAGWVETIELLDVEEVHLLRFPYAVTRPSERLAMRFRAVNLATLEMLAAVPRLESVDLDAAGDIAAPLAKVPVLRRLVWGPTGCPAEGWSRWRR